MQWPRAGGPIYFRIGQVAEILGVETHVLRYWEKEFPELAPRKNRHGQRMYTEEDVRIAMLIKYLLYDEGYTIEGARKKLRQWIHESGVPENVQAHLRSELVAERLKHIKDKLTRLLQLLDRNPPLD
jgi:DNA-binding transcriptional MerR regulator